MKVRSIIESLDPYVAGLSINEIQKKYGLSTIYKMASNENPLGTSPRVQECIKRNANFAFRYPQNGNPRLIKALAEYHNIDAKHIVVGNGSDEVIDTLIRILAEPKINSISCFKPCFSIYPIQSKICGVEIKRIPLNEDFSFNFDKLFNTIDSSTKLVFITTPDNPSGYCPSKTEVSNFVSRVYDKNPECLVVIDEAYMDFSENEVENSLLYTNPLPNNVAILRTFSKSFGLAGIRLGYGILPKKIASYFRCAQIPFSVNILAEEAGLEALKDTDFRSLTLSTVKEGRTYLTNELKNINCKVFPSSSNFIMFKLPDNTLNPKELFEKLLQHGIIIRYLASYDLPNYLRVSIGNNEENITFIKTMQKLLH